MNLWIIRDERIWWKLRDHLETSWKAAARLGRPLAVEVGAESKKRSVQQNKRYWALIGQIAKDASIDGRKWDGEIWHEAFRKEFLPLQELPTGKVGHKSTTQLNPQEFNEYMEQIEAYAVTELGIQFLEVA